MTTIDRIFTPKTVKVGVSQALALACLCPFALSAFASDNLHGTAAQNHIYRNGHTASYWQRHPKVKSAAVGAGVGVAAGALTGLVTHKGVVRGAAIGAGTGAGVGLIHSSKTMRNHPIAKDVAEGTAVAFGLGLASHKGPHEGKHSLQYAAVGGAAGLGVGLLKNLK